MVVGPSGLSALSASEVEGTVTGSSGAIDVTDDPGSATASVVGTAVVVTAGFS